MQRPQPGLGIIPEVAKIRTKSAAIFGLDGAGAFTAELLARAGIGKLTLLDPDKVHVPDLGCLMYRPTHVGRYRAEATS